MRHEEPGENGLLALPAQIQRRIMVKRLKRSEGMKFQHRSA
ncbi:hypothetical protein OG589_22825 [Sphaerisporangium sp. NBC_01403]